MAVVHISIEMLERFVSYHVSQIAVFKVGDIVHTFCTRHASYSGFLLLNNV